jgi:hypothetical protein
VASLCLAAAAGAAPSPAEPPWQAADAIRADLAEAQEQVLFDESSAAALGRAESRLAGPLRQGLARHAPGELREIEASLVSLSASSGEAALAAAQGRIVAALVPGGRGGCRR